MLLKPSVEPIILATPQPHLDITSTRPSPETDYDEICLAFPLCTLLGAPALALGPPLREGSNANSNVFFLFSACAALSAFMFLCKNKDNLD